MWGRLRFLGFCIFVTLVVFCIMPVMAAYSGPCPIGTGGAPQLIDPGLSSGALCRGACGMDCPDERCDLLTDSTGAATPITIGIQSPRGICTYNNVLECPTHAGCQIHDGCFDVCTEHYHMNSQADTCHLNCDLDCVKAYGLTNCVLWADAPTTVYNSQFTAAMGYIMDYSSGVDFSGYYFYSDPPVFTPVSPTPTLTPTSTPTTIRPTTIMTTPEITTLIPETTVPVTVITTGSPDTSGTEPPLAVQRQKCNDAGGKWDYFSEGCIIPEGTNAPTVGIPDLFKDKPTIQYTPDDFKKAADDAVKNGQNDLAVQYLDAAENIYLKNSPDKSTRTAEVDRNLAALEADKASVYHNWNGHGDDEDAAKQNVKSLNADAATKETPFDLPGFEAAAGIMALCLLFLYRRQNN